MQSSINQCNLSHISIAGGMPVTDETEQRAAFRNHYITLICEIDTHKNNGWSHEGMLKIMFHILMKFIQKLWENVII